MIDLDIKDKNQLYQLLVGILGFTLILIACLIIMTPFFPGILMAAMFTLSTWPAFIWLKKRLKGKTSLAALLMTGMLASFFIFPLVIIGTSLTENFTKVYAFLQTSLKGSTEATAQSLHEVAYIGEYLEKAWLFFANDKEKLSATLQEYAAPTSQEIIKIGADIGYGLLDITLGVLIAYFFFRHGTKFADRIGNLINKFAGARGRSIIDISKNTLISVIYGILGTALAQGLLAALGFWLAGIPGATFLGLITFFLSLIPMGPPLLWVPASIWLYSSGETSWSLFLFLWGLLVISAVDNFLKPYFISLGSNLPLVLVLLGILGGVIAFGFIGVFIGPTFLAVAYSLIMEWSTIRESK